jgi:mutator protein MutT
MNMSEVIHLAGGVLLDPMQRIGLLHRNAEELKWWELPGGKVEDGELSTDTVVRELAEELGIRVTIVKKLGEACFNFRKNDYRYEWFLTEVVDGKPSPREQKFDKFRYFEVSDLDDMPISTNVIELTAQIKDGTIDLL